MNLEVFNIQDGKVLSTFKDFEAADRFIASFEDTDIGSQLQIRQSNVPSISKPILRIVRGIPGSSKTTFAAKHFPGVFHVENDMFLIRGNDYKWSPYSVRQAIAWCIDMVRNALEHKIDVIVCNTFTKRKFIQHYKKLADDYGADFQVYRCTGNFKNVHGLSDTMVDGFKNAMEDWPGEIIVDPHEV